MKNTNSIGTSLSESDFKSGNAIDGFDTNLWLFKSGQYPKLKSFIKTSEVCATPTISVVNGKLHFECETYGAEYHYTIKVNSYEVNNNTYQENVDLNLVPTYTVTCYASADGYVDSETATATITIDKTDVNADGTVDISDVNKVISVICRGE